MNTTKAIDLLKNIYEKSKSVFPCEIQNIFLYGSYARGDYTPDSDVDIMILVKGIAPENLWRYRSAITSKSSELGLKYDLLIVPLIKDSDIFNKYLNVLPFYQNVHREGIRIGA